MMVLIGNGLAWIGPALFLLGSMVALFSNIRYGAILMGIAITFQVGADAIRRGWRRPVAVIAPLVISVALITVAILLPRSSV
jgi:predicted exporter